MAGPVFFLIYGAFSLKTKMKKKKILKLIVLMVITLSVIKLLIAALISTSGFALYNIKQEISDISLKNQILQEKVVTASSFMVVQVKASDLGLKRANIVLNYVAAKTPIAMKE